MATVLDARVKQKVATEAQWLADTTILLEGEQAFVVNSGNVPINFKIGDGAKKFADLPYYFNYGSSAVYKGSVIPSSSSPSGDFWVIATEPGVYANLNNYTVPINSLAVISRVDNVYSISITALNTGSVLRTDLNMVSNPAKNIFSTGSIIVDQFVNSSGNIAAQAGWKILNLPVDSSKSRIYVSSLFTRQSTPASPAYWRFDDASNVRQSWGSFFTGTDFVLDIPVGATKLLIDIKSNLDTDAVFANASFSYTGILKGIYGSEIEVNSLSNPYVREKTLGFDRIPTNENSNNLMLTGTIVPDAFINSVGGTQPGAGWKYIKIPLDPSKTKVWVNGIKLRPNIALSSGYWKFNVDPVVFAGFITGSEFSVDIPSGATEFWIDLKSPTDADSAFSQAIITYEKTPEVVSINGFEIKEQEQVLKNIETVQPVSRKPTICFIFDDGLASDANVVAKFDAYNFKCGFALKAISFDAPRYLGYQDKGYEILSHSINHEHFDDTSTYTLAQAEAEIKNSKSILETAGFNVTGWVTPYSTMKDEWKYLVKKYYNYGFTVGFLPVTPETVDDSYHIFWNELRTMHRVTLETSTQENIILAIDGAIANTGFLVMYAHAFPGTLTDAKLTAILDYLVSKSADIDVLKPVDAFQKYYQLGHEDILGLKALIEV